MANAPLRRIVLVHGGAHGAWCWDSLTSRLRAKGFAVSARDLPGHGDDPTPPNDVGLSDYTRRVVETIKSGTVPVLLVGHSLGGAPISQAAEQIPEAVGRLVYLCAMMLADGEAISHFRASDLETQPERVAARGFVPGNAGSHRIDPMLAPDIFYHLCSPELTERAVARLCPQPDRPLLEPVRLSETRWGTVPKTYVVCTEDRAIPPERQRWLAARRADTKIVEIVADHSPFYSQPDALADLLAHECLV